MPWFKNSVIYEFTKPTHFTQVELEQALRALPFRPCTGQELQHLGWLSPYGDEHEIGVIAHNEHFLLKAKKETKLLPASVIKQTLQTKTKQREQEHHRPLTKNEKAALKDEVITDLVPRAFSKYQSYYLWIDLKHQRIIVDCSSRTQAESIVSLLRKCLGSLPVIPIKHSVAPELVLTEWVKNSASVPLFQLGDEAELKDPLEGQGIIRCRQQDLVCDEITQHLNAGKQITKLKMIKEDNLDFILHNDLTLKRIKYHSALLDNTEKLDKTAEETRISANFFIMSEVLSEIFNQINKAFNAISVK